MSARDSGGSIAGLTMRDFFAAHALAGVMEKLMSNTTHIADLAKWSYAYADAMLAEREK